MYLDTPEKKHEFYNDLLKTRREAYVLHEKDGKKTPFLVMRSKDSENGFLELNCHLFDYSFTPTDVREIAFLKEQNFIVIGDRAYDVQAPFCIISFDKHLGEFIEISKKECVEILRTKTIF
jgi:hypothetical protein